MFYENIRAVSGENIAHNAAANSGDDCDENNEEKIVSIERIQSNAGTVYRKDCQTDGIGENQHPVEEFLTAQQCSADDRNEYDQRCTDGNDDGLRIIKYRRRQCTENQIADHAAADCRRQPQNADPEQVHIFLERRNGSGQGKGDRADHFKNQNGKLHVFFSFQTRYTVVLHTKTEHSLHHKCKVLCIGT